MNTPLFHLAVSHLPIVGELIGILVFLAGILLKKNEVVLTALALFVFSAVTSILTFYTGNTAVEVVTNISGISETRIHTHEAYAKSFLILTLALGAVSVLSFIAELKKNKYAIPLTFLCLTLAIADAILAKYVGVSGAEIRHSEIRTNSQVIDLAP